MQPPSALPASGTRTVLGPVSGTRVDGADAAGVPGSLPEVTGAGRAAVPDSRVPG
jgi:hypothetical protein